jgi:hypothetical protein
MSATSQLTLKIAEKLFNQDQINYKELNKATNRIIYGKDEATWEDCQGKYCQIFRLLWIKLAEAAVNEMRNRIASIHAEARDTEWDVGFEAYRAEV